MSASSLLDQLLQALRAEQQALVRGDADVLPLLAERKAKSFDRLGAAMRASPPGERAALSDALRTAQRLNDTNAALIASRMAVNRARLDTLMALAGHGGAPVYGARGDVPAFSAPARASASA
jgi:flagellar biosynthesis/type III secretory pathway chaperone